MCRLEEVSFCFYECVQPRLFANSSDIFPKVAHNLATIMSLVNTYPKVSEFGDIRVACLHISKIFSDLATFVLLV